MQKQSIIEYTETFNNSFDIILSYFSQSNDELTAIDKIEKTVNVFEKAVSDNPYIYRVSQSLVDLAGVSSVREANINGYKILYEVCEQEKETVITAILLLSQRQSIQKQLLNHCLHIDKL